MKERERETHRVTLERVCDTIENGLYTVGRGAERGEGEGGLT